MSQYKKLVVKFSCSEVSAITKYAYKNYGESNETVYKNYFDKICNNACSDLVKKSVIQTPEIIVKTIVNQRPILKETIEKCKEMSLISRTSRDVAKVKSVAKVLIKFDELELESSDEEELIVKPKLDAKIKLINKHVEKQINCSYGIGNEDIADKLYIETRLRKTYTDQTTYQKIVFETNEIDFILVGRIDRYEMINDEKVVMEIKNRVSRLNRKIFDNEKVQTHLYMYLLDAKKSIITEQCNGSISVINCDLNTDFLNEILDNIKTFCCNVMVHRNEYIKNNL